MLRVAKLLSVGLRLQTPDRRSQGAESGAEQRQGQQDAGGPDDGDRQPETSLVTEDVSGYEADHRRADRQADETERSEERRAGKECVRTFKSRWTAYP